jgi:predicted nucleic acid-binding Zn finger protein
VTILIFIIEAFLFLHINGEGSRIPMYMEENKDYINEETALLCSIHVFSVFVLDWSRFGIRIISEIATNIY